MSHHIFCRLLAYPVFLLAIIVGACGSVFAQADYTRPDYFEVHRVDADDVLNVREQPTSASAIIGSLAPGAGPVEVLWQDRSWGYVNVGEFGGGYVSMAYLRPLDLPRILQSDLPQASFCGGTEPFWGVTFSSTQMIFNDYGMGEAETTFDLGEGGLIGNSANYASYLAGNNSDVSFVATVTNRICSDGMSDADYAREMLLLMFGEGQTRSYTGCCSVNLAAN